MSIAYDVHKEMAQRIVNEARSSDKTTIAVYFENSCNKCINLSPFFVAWRYKSSPKDRIYVQNGHLGNFQYPFVIESKEALKSFILPPGNNYADLTLLYVLTTGEKDVPEKLSWTEKKCLNAVVKEAFPNNVLHNYVDTGYEGGIEEFLGGDDFLSFVWNLLN
jgi:hypothetical protein